MEGELGGLLALVSVGVIALLSLAFVLGIASWYSTLKPGPRGYCTAPAQLRVDTN